MVILAAGAGRRLAGANGGRPKWLTEVGSRTIADRQLAALEGSLGADDCVVVVGGYRVDDLRRFLDRWPGSLAMELLDNEAYASRNNWYSLLVALRRLDQRRWSSSVVVLNGDLCAPPRWYEPFLLATRRGPDDGGLVAVDGERPLTEEAMKVAVVATAGGGQTCTSIGKVGVDHPAGEYVGMAGLGSAGWRRLLVVLESFESEPDLADAWYEVGFQRLMDDALLQAWPVPDSGWVEIDDEADLATARTLLADA